jgi:hypothetical protein
VNLFVVKIGFEVLETVGAYRGKMKAKKLSMAQRVKIAKTGAMARWKKDKKK